MKFFDTHMHCYLSFDSNADPKDYIDETTEFLVFTDHFDLNNPFTKRDDIPDFQQLVDLQDEFKEDYQVDLLLGIETGYVSERKADIHQLHQEFDFDLILLSCHHNNVYDYMDEPIKEEPYDSIQVYFEQMLEAVTEVKYANIMTHFDYGTRIYDMDVDRLKTYEDIMVAIFDQIISSDMAFELNSKSMYGYGNFDLYEYAIKLYQSRGGKLFSLGSDAHVAKDKFAHFDQSIALLNRLGVNQVAVFKQQKLELIPTSEIVLPSQ